MKLNKNSLEYMAQYKEQSDQMNIFINSQKCQNNQKLLKNIFKCQKESKYVKNGQKIAI